MVTAWVLNPKKKKKSKKAKRSKSRSRRRSCSQKAAAAVSRIFCQRKGNWREALLKRAKAARRKCGWLTRSLASRRHRAAKASQIETLAAEKKFPASQGWQTLGLGRHRKVFGNPCCTLPMMGNPSFTEALSAGFNVQNLKTAGIMTAGGLANSYLGEFVVNRFLNSSWKKGLKAGVIGIAGAGLLGAASGAANSSLGAPVLTGGLVQTMIKVVNSLLEGKSGAQEAAPSYMQQAAASRPIVRRTVTSAPRMVGLGEDDVIGMSNVEDVLSEI
jgi:hypothetical protein